MTDHVAGPDVVFSRAVVTGAAGFIGGHLVSRLLDAGFEVVSLDERDPVRDTEAAENLAGALEHPRCTFHQVDLSERGWESAVDAAAVVFHLAGLPGVRSSWGARFDEYVRCNMMATRRVMEAALVARVPRLVLASSSSVYGRSAGEPSAESVPSRPLSPYGATKVAAEALATAYAGRADSTISLAVLRYFTVYGPRQRPDMLIGRVLRAARGAPAVTLYGSGEQSRDFTYVDDVVDATLAAGCSRARGVFNVGTGVATDVRSVVRQAEAVTGRAIPVRFAPAAEGDTPATLADCTLARDALGWSARVDLTTGLRRHLDWMDRDRARRAGTSATA